MRTDLFMTPLSIEQFFRTSIVRSLHNSYGLVAVALRSPRQILAPVVKTSVTVRFGGTCIQSQRFKQDKHRDTTDWRMRNATARRSRWTSFKARGGWGRRQREREHYKLHTWNRVGCGSSPTIAWGCGSERAVGGSK